MSAPTPGGNAELFSTMGLHQAVLAVFDIAAAPPDRFDGLVAAFNRMDNAITGTVNLDAIDGFRDGLLAAIYLAISSLRVAKGTTELNPLTGHERGVVDELVSTLPDEAAEAVLLARESPIVTAFFAAAGKRRKNGPVPNEMLLRAAVAAVRAMLALHGDDDAESRWNLLGQFFGSISLGALKR